MQTNDYYSGQLFHSQVVIAAIYYSPQLLLQTLNEMQIQMQQQVAEPISSHFIKQWIHDTDCFLGIHDRKLYVIGMCTLLSMGDAKPPVLNELAPKILPCLMLVFDGLKRAYQARAQDGEEEESEDDDEDCEGEALSTDDDEAEDCTTLGGALVKKSAEHGFSMTAELRVGTWSIRWKLFLFSIKIQLIQDDTDDDSDDDDDSDTELDETALESYTTPIDDETTDNPVDEFVTFQQVMTSKT